MKNEKFPELIEKKRKHGKTTEVSLNNYIDSSEILLQVLKSMVREGIQKDPPVDGVPAKEANGRYKLGYQNISAIIIRLKKPPYEYKSPEELEKERKKAEFEAEKAALEKTKQE